MALNGLLQLNAPAVVRVDEVGTDQQQNDIGGFEVVVNGLCPVGAASNLPVIPGLDEPLAFEGGQVGPEIVQYGFVFVGVGDEGGDGVGPGVPSI